MTNGELRTANVGFFEDRQSRQLPATTAAGAAARPVRAYRFPHVAPIAARTLVKARPWNKRGLQALL
jgi:hypothetical protein